MQIIYCKQYFGRTILWRFGKNIAKINTTLHLRKKERKNLTRLNSADYAKKQYTGLNVLHGLVDSCSIFVQSSIFHLLAPCSETRPSNQDLRKAMAKAWNKITCVEFFSRNDEN